MEHSWKKNEKNKLSGSAIQPPNQPYILLSLFPLFSGLFAETKRWIIIQL